MEVPLLVVPPGLRLRHDQWVRMSDAEAIVAALVARIEGREGWEATAFGLRRLWIHSELGDAVVKVVYRQRGDAWAGFAKRDLLTWVYQVTC